jgi:hypothetical protein
MKDVVNDEHYITYKGHPLLNYTLLVFIVGMLVFGFITNSDITGDMIFFLLFGIFGFVYLSFQVYYFEVSDKHLVIRNHNMFWLKKGYNLGNIQIIFEQPYRRPNAIRVINTNGRGRLFMAGSLTDRQWVALKEQFEKANVPIADEFVDDITFTQYEFVLFKEIKEIFTRQKK